MYSTSYASPLGTITLAADDEHLLGLWLEGQKYAAATLSDDVVQRPECSVLVRATAWLDAYFAGSQPAIAELPLAPQGSAFRKAVWRILCDIPYGRCITYGDIAKHMARHLGKSSMSSQAVGGAVGHNPISIIIPCHRVVGAKGNLTGYAGGLGLKVKLLEHEGVNMSRYFIPRKGTAL